MKAQLPKRQVAEHPTHQKQAQQKTEDEIEQVVRGVDRRKTDADRHEEKEPTLARQSKLPPTPSSSKDPHRPNRLEWHGDHGQELANDPLGIIADCGAGHAA